MARECCPQLARHLQVMPNQTFELLNLCEHYTSQPMSLATSLTHRGPLAIHPATSNQKDRPLDIRAMKPFKAPKAKPSPQAQCEGWVTSGTGGAHVGCPSGQPGSAQPDTAGLDYLSMTEHILGFLVLSSSIPVTHCRGCRLSLPHKSQDEGEKQLANPGSIQSKLQSPK